MLRKKVIRIADVPFLYFENSEYSHFLLNLAIKRYHPPCYKVFRFNSSKD